MNSLHYFAYGSNMLEARLQMRCTSARMIGVGWAEGFALNFSKRGKDASGKATLVEISGVGACVHGVLFTLDASDQPNLDRVEGPGYARLDNILINSAGIAERVTAFTYIARPEHMHPSLLPFDWYLGLTIAGAEAADLPCEHIERLRREPNIPDPDLRRASRIGALELLKATARDGKR